MTTSPADLPNPANATPPDDSSPSSDGNSFEQRLDTYVVSQRILLLEEQLEQRPALAERVDFAWTTHDSPLGELLLAVHQGRLIRVAFAVEDFAAVLEQLGHELGSRTLRAPRQGDDVRRQLDEYFAGQRTHFDVPHSLQLTHGHFRRQVQEALHEVPFGRTASYSDLAAAAGSPKAVRAVGTACATNPLPIVLPCHRIVRADGSFGNYLGGPNAKAFLLSHEADVASRTGVA